VMLALKMLWQLEEDKLENMIRDVGAKAFAQTHVYEKMFTDVQTPLYVDSTKFTRLSFALITIK